MIFITLCFSCQNQVSRFLHFNTFDTEGCSAYLFKELDIKGQTLFFSFPPPPVLARYDELYAFSYNPKQNEEERVRGWQIIDLTEEYDRMGVPNSEWQLSDANHDYKVIDY